MPDPKTVKNRWRVCLQPDEARKVEVERLLGMGASMLDARCSMLDDRREADGTGWAVLADPEGNKFCVLRSAEERARTP